MNNRNVDERKKALIKASREYFKEEVEELKRINKSGVATYNDDFRLKLKNKTYYFCKLYAQDKWERLEREFEAVSYFGKEKILNVPTAYFADRKHYFAVYSYEIGERKSSGLYTAKDILAVADSAVRLHLVKPSVKLRIIFPKPTGRACFKLAGHIVNYKTKLADFLKYYEGLDKEDLFKKRIESFGYLKRADRVLKKIAGDVSSADMEKPIPRQEWRFNHGDFTVDNIIFQKDKGGTNLCFFDWEYCGWDDPLRMVGDFLVHDQHRGFSEELKQLFFEEYGKKIKLGRKDTARLRVIMNLMEVEWIAIYLRLLTPETLKRRKRILRNFDEKTYVEERLTRAQERILNLEKRLFS